MSPEALRERILQLENEIVLQKELLKKLVQDKSLAQRQLNAILDPVARLPLEISSEIFLQSVHLAAFPTSAINHAPMLLLHICSAWTTIALSTPALWASIRIDFPCAKNLTIVLPIWFQRARHSLLSVSLRGRFEIWKLDIVDILLRHAGQLKCLEILDIAPDDVYIPNLFEIGTESPSATPLPFPMFEMLETLHLRCARSERQGGRGFRLSQVLHLLRRTPNIVELSFTATMDSENLVTPVSQDAKILLPKLRRLLAEPYPGADHGQIFSYFSLPAVEVVSVPTSAVFLGAFYDFLLRSTPPLRQLTLGLTRGRDSAKLHACLRFIPTLERFEMLWDSEIMNNLLVTLADSPSMLPDLRSLTIRFVPWMSILEDSWRLLIRVVATRRIQFRVLGELSREPPEDVLDAFVDLLDDGVDVQLNFWCGMCRTIIADDPQSVANSQDVFARLAELMR